jgi:Photosynthetic reaction centre cytochrome C subunit
MTKVFSVSVLALVLIVGWFVAPARSSSASPQQKQSAFENIKVMNDMSEADIMKAMRQWQDDLGTNCSFCHAGADFPSEDNPKKQTARVMYKMLNMINKDFLDGKASCATCHNGATKPAPVAQ